MPAFRFRCILLWSKVLLGQPHQLWSEMLPRKLSFHWTAVQREWIQVKVAMANIIGPSEVPLGVAGEM